MKWRLWIGIAVSALCVVLVARRVNWASFVTALAGVQIGWLGAGAALMTASYGCSGLRWRHVMSRGALMSRREAFDVVMIANMANLVAPSRAGDLARAALVARRRAMPVSHVLGGVLVERYADVVMLVVLAVILSLAVRFPPAIRAGILLLAGAGVVAMVALVVLAERLPAIAGRIVGTLLPSLGGKLSAFLAGLVGGIRAAGHPGLLAGTLWLSACIWALAGVAMSCITFAFRLPVPWYAGLFVLLVVNLGGIIPASPGSIGVYHYLAMTALAVWVADANVALGFAVVAHATGIVVVTVLGLIALAIEHESLLGVERAGEAVLGQVESANVNDRNIG